jgi:hypothetical protein
VCLPAGSIFGDGGIPPPTTPMPIDAVALDQPAALQMAMWYNERDTINGWHQLIFASGIDRAAVFAQARLNRQWPPNGIPPSQTMSGPSPSSSPVNTPAPSPAGKKRSSAKG